MKTERDDLAAGTETEEWQVTSQPEGKSRPESREG